MESQNQQYLIAQELAKIVSNVDIAEFNIVGYELNGHYKIGVSSSYGMFPGSFIKKIVKLSQEYKFNFYISDCCATDIEGDLFLIIY